MPLQLLGIGTGPVSRIGYKSQRGPVEFHGIDIAAKQYREALLDFGVQLAPELIPSEGNVYALAEKYQDKQFDMIVAMNVFDELEDPGLALRQMLAFCKPGGYVFIYNIADRKAEQPGMEDILWRFKVVGGDIVLHNAKLSISIASLLDSEEYYLSFAFDGRFVRSRIQKRGATNPEIKNLWEEGRTETENFWRAVITGKSKHTETWQDRLNPDKEFDANVLDVICNGQKQLKVLDVGAGPCTSLGYLSDKYDIELTCCDYHADLFEQQLQENGVEVPGKTIFADALELQKSFPSGHFDVVYSRNALDHVLEPIKALREMLEVTAPGGIIYLQGIANEGEKEFYHGFHQWNFVVEGDELVVWRPFQRFVISEIFNDKIDKLVATGVDTYTVVIHKVK